MTLDEATLKKIVKSRVRKHTRESFHYFWASFGLQIIVYALLSHVIVKNWNDPSIVVPGVCGMLLFIPFTVMLLKKFKSMATNKEASMASYVSRHHELLASFYRFKKRYEMVLIPVATVIGILVTFELYVPGGVLAYPKAAAIIFLVTLASCIIAIQAENKKSFEQPLSKLRAILNDFNAD